MTLTTRLPRFWNPGGGIKVDEYNIVCEEELSNDMSHELSVSSEKPSDDDVEELKEGAFSFRTNTIANWMCFEGELKSGTYLIDICW